MTLEGMPVREIVCARGLDAFVLPGGSWPCGSRYIRPQDAAELLGISRVRLWTHIANGGVPLDPFRWVSLDWVLGILEARERRDA